MPHELRGPHAPDERFNRRLCPRGPPIRSHCLSAAPSPPLLVELRLGYGPDVVFALNTGVVARYDRERHMRHLCGILSSNRVDPRY